jgi:hypothetical protein
MDNRERDKMKNNDSGSDVNRNTSSQLGKDKGSSSADFGQNIGKSEELNEPNSRSSSTSGSGYGSSGSSGSSSGDRH